MPPDVIESLLEKVTSPEHRVLFMLLDARLAGVEKRIEDALAAHTPTTWADVAKEGVSTLRAQPLIVVAFLGAALILGAGGIAQVAQAFIH